MVFTMKLADRVIAVDSLYRGIFDLCADYRAEGKADLTVKVTEREIAFEREKAAREAARDKRLLETYSDAYLETLAVYRAIAEAMPAYDTFLTHGCAVAKDGAAYLFIAPAGTGKTTHARLWQSCFPDAFIVNGDKPLITVSSDVCRVCGTPWAGKEALQRNCCVPLKAVCFLRRAGENRVEKIPFSDAFADLIGQVYRPASPAAFAKTIELISTMARTVGFYRLWCNTDPEAARLACAAMEDPAAPQKRT